MNNYLNTFFDASASVDILLNNDLSSEEIKKSATKLQQTIQPCIKEIQESAAKLQQLMLLSFDELQYGLDVLQSKPKIAKVVTSEIWEQLGEMSGHYIKISQSSNRCKNEAIEDSRNFWNTQMRFLKNKYFIDKNGQSKKAVGWDEKKMFVNDIKNEVNKLDTELYINIKMSLESIYKEVAEINLETMVHYIEISYFSFANQCKLADIKQRLELIKHEIITKFQNPIGNSPEYVLKLLNRNSADLFFLVEGTWGSILWEDVVKFENKVLNNIENLITAIFDNRIKLVTDAIEKIIEFYNNFLAKQQRYQRETPEQQLAEKTWIDKQRQDLMQVQNFLEVILNGN